MAATLLPHVLVVDDDPSICLALATALQPAYQVHTAASGTEAGAVLGRYPIAVIILDAVLGEEHGLELVPRFRRLSPARILLLTGHSTEDLAIRAVNVGIDYFLKKPQSLAALAEALGCLVPRTNGAADLAARARRYLDDHVAKPFRAIDLGGQLGVTEINLRRCFRAAYGKTPHRYLTEVRMQRAATLLLTTDFGVERVALEVGFPHIAWFNKVFKHLFGVTPSAFRANGGPRTTGGR
jgi:YesN/AraC family two-component response regulator